MPAFGVRLAPAASPSSSTVRTMSASSGLETQLHAPGVRVLCRIGDRLLRDPIKTGADAGRQIVDLANDGNLKTGAALLKTIPARHQAFEAEGEAEFLDIGRTQAHQRAAQGFHHMRRRARDAPAFLVERRAFALRGVGGGGGLRRDGGKRLAEFVVQLACKMAPLLVLHFDQLSRQGVAFGKRGLQPFGKGVEDAGDDRQFREIETGQARGKIVRRQAAFSPAPMARVGRSARASAA